MEKIIQSLIDNWIRGVDTYTHNGSTWLIFTDKKQWVVELTDNKILWYNYNFFKQIFSLTSLDVVQNQHLITKWVEDNVMNKGELIRSYDYWIGNPLGVDDVLENGVRHTEDMVTNIFVDDTIQNGVKETVGTLRRTLLGVDDIIQKGVKETQFNPYVNKSWVEGVIKGGVKETKSDDFNVSQFLCEEVIDKGVKETNHVDVMKFFDNKMEDALQNGVKETKQKKNALLILDTSGRELILESHLVVRDGVKETNYDTDNHTDDVKEVIREGVKSSIPRQYVGENIIDKIIDKGELETYDVDWDVPTDLIEDVINDGVKETKGDASQNPMGKVTKVIKEGIKNPTG